MRTIDRQFCWLYEIRSMPFRDADENRGAIGVNTGGVGSFSSNKIRKKINVIEFNWDRFIYLFLLKWYLCSFCSIIGSQWGIFGWLKWIFGACKMVNALMNRGGLLKNP